MLVWILIHFNLNTQSKYYGHQLRNLIKCNKLNAEFHLYKLENAERQFLSKTIQQNHNYQN